MKSRYFYSYVIKKIINSQIVFVTAKGKISKIWMQKTNALIAFLVPGAGIFRLKLF